MSDTENRVCPACKSSNEEDAAYCDQCGQPLSAPPADPGEGDCPACGGQVESRGEGKGVCLSCGLELVETPEKKPDAPAAVAEPGAAGRLIAAILKRTGAGIDLENAVTQACHEVLAAAPGTVDAKADEGPLPCPLCGAENPHDALHCAGCGLWFEKPRAPQPCLRCGRQVTGVQCACGAVLTLTKLLEYIEPSVRWVCALCKAPYAVPQPKCPDCGGGLLSADRIKAFAAERRGEN
jgi:predicted amidophosphoribosyltransferase